MLSRRSHSGFFTHSFTFAALERRLSKTPVTLSSVPCTVRNHGSTSILRPLLRHGTDSLSCRSPVAGRTLATAVDDFKFDSNLPYDSLTRSSFPPFRAPRPYDMRPFDPSSPLTIPEPGPPQPPTKMNSLGIPGDPEDMLAVFDACLSVDKLERAALVLKRLNAVGNLSLEEQLLLNHKYLRASLAQISASPDRKRAEDLHKWYQLEMCNRGLPYTAETIACMLKASLLSERGPRLERLIRRYMGMAPDEAGLVVLNMADILSDSDLAVITDICPTYNFSKEPEDLPPGTTLEDDNELPALDQADKPPGLQALDLVPELVTTPVKGTHMANLRKSLAKVTALHDSDISMLEENERRDIQRDLERGSITAAIERWRTQTQKMVRHGLMPGLKSTHPGNLTHDLASWLVDMEAALRAELALIEVSENKENKSEEDLVRCIYGPFLRQADPARLAAVTILCTVNAGAMNGIERGIPISKLVSNIAKVVQEDMELQQKQEQEATARKARTLARRRERRQVTLKGGSDSPETSDQGMGGAAPKEEPALERSVAQAEESTAVSSAESLTSMSLDNSTNAKSTSKKTMREPWSLQIRVHVGSILLKTLLESAKVKAVTRCKISGRDLSQQQPAFTHLQQLRKGKKVGVVTLNSALSKKLLREPIGEFLAKHLPMVVEPRPWKGFLDGCLLDSKVQLVRVKPGNKEQSLYNQAAVDCGDMDQVIKGLHVLGKTAWRVSKDVLNVMLEAWNTGEAIANFPPLSPDLETPPEPDASADPRARWRWIHAVKAVENKRSGLHSQRCFMNQQLEVARAFRNQTIYFPHNLDYRGRAYPIPTYFNHMGADHVRALLKFDKGKELGERGLRWLKIHLANLYGLDKSSFDEREAFTNENVANVIDSATKPLDGQRWWLKASEPWQCLSACFELKAALDLDDPTKYVSQLPIHQDGTCNGLQHYAALGGDVWGARQVNLEPGDRPADVYSAVAELVTENIAKDVAAGSDMAKILQGKITRKVVKQTVMTNVYGVTFIGAKLQICKQLDAFYPTLGKEHGYQSNALFAIYVAKHVFNALATMFRGAHDIQYWLGKVGGRVCRALTPAQLEQIAETSAASPKVPKRGGKGKAASKSSLSSTPMKAPTFDFKALDIHFRSSLVWTTPLRMPVVQPYRKSSAKEIKTCLQAVICSMQDQTSPVNSRKQLQAFPPNFIHSLDASHMMLSALRCDERKLDFAAVHDSFWTHACDVDDMNEVLRESFIQIHEDDVIGRLAAEFKTRHRGSVYLAHIDRDSAVGKKIRELRETKVNGKKRTPMEELLLEHKRQTLISEGNFSQAKDIVTPASIYENMSASEVDLAIEEDAKAIGLGEIHEDDLAAAAPKISEAIDEEMVEPGDDVPQTTDVMASTQEIPTELWERRLDQYKKGFSEVIREKKTTPKKSKRTLALWLPLTIPDIPRKGEFDVQRLRHSKYFFS